MIANARTPEAAAAQNTQGPRILAVDYGRKRIGLALSDTLQLTARPFMTFTRTNRRSDTRRLRNVCREHDVARIIVGMPVHIDGETSEMSREAAAFAARIARDLRIEVELLDERLTSWEAQQTVAETKSRSRNPSPSSRGSSAGKRSSLDDVAAAVLLRDYLESKRAAKAAEPSSEKA